MPRPLLHPAAGPMSPAERKRVSRARKRAEGRPEREDVRRLIVDAVADLPEAERRALFDTIAAGLSDEQREGWSADLAALLKL